MGERKFTEEQESAITTRKKSLLVSAAAGSGKTATLIERIIRSLLDPEKPEDISRILIVTFTNAAVGEIKERIAKALADALEKNPENEAVARQITLLPLARICTIDAFCNDFLKRNSDRAGVPPNYRIAETAEAGILSYSVLEALINALYDGELPELASAEEFAGLADMLTSSKHNRDLEEIFLKLYEKSKSVPEGVGIFRKITEEYKSASPTDNRFISRSTAKLHAAAEHYLNAYKMIAGELEACDGRKQSFSELARSDMELCRSIADAKTYREIKSALSSLSFMRVPSVKEKTAAQLEAVYLHGELKAEFCELRDKFFFYSEDELCELFRGLHSALSLLSSFLEEFDRIYTKEKLRRAMLEYSDIERYTYSALYDENGEKTSVAHAAAAEYSSVYIDEYQDVNALQNKIFEAISRPDNRFMVGDIKQSIYGFRSAEPDIFKSMKSSFPALEDSEDSDCASIFMSRNFRSDKGIIDFVNSVFDVAFSLTRESIGYLEKDRLTCSKIHADGENNEYRAPKFMLISPEKAESDDEEIDKRKLECEAVAERTSELLDFGRLNDGRQISPSDIAIILRGSRERMAAYKEALEKRGIPSESADDKDFFLNSEVLLALSLLNAIDNPQKDIYLVGLMCSPLFGFSADELYRVRAEKSDCSFYMSLKSYCAKHPEFEKGSYFLERLSYYRTLSEGMNVDKLILRLYNDTGMLSLAEKSGGRENLLLLYDYAKKFTASRLKGLFNFIKFINNIIERKTEFDSRLDGEETDTVKIITVHASKGLEYPIVFYADTDSALRDKESRERVAFSEKFGLSLRLRSPGGLALVDNPVHNSVQEFNSQRYFQEELRVIYVALTRAREELYIVGCIPEKSEEYLEKLDTVRKFLDGYSIYSVGSALELMLTCARPSELNIIKSFEGSELSHKITKEEKIQNSPSLTDMPTTEELRERFEFKYPHIHMTSLPEKLSISKLYPEVLDGSEDEEVTLSLDRTAMLCEKRDTLPEFYTGTVSDESARRGIATHSFLQFFDMDNLLEKGAEAELNRLVENGFISEENRGRVRISEIERFAESEFFKKIKGAERLWREFRFNTRLPARLFTKNGDKKAHFADKTILVQGVIDCIYEDLDGGLHLTDYKTDRLTKAELADKSLAEKTLSDKHSLQLSYYSLAIKEIFGREPCEISVYSLPLGDTVKIEKLVFE